MPGLRIRSVYTRGCGGTQVCRSVRGVYARVPRASRECVHYSYTGILDLVRCYTMHGGIIHCGLHTVYTGASGSAQLV